VGKYDYSMLYALMQQESMRNGWMVAMHISASDSSDRELVVLPWTMNAIDPRDMLDSLLDICDLPNASTLVKTRNPHGRRTWRIPLPEGNFINISMLSRHGTSEFR
jgi:hypothetical protein